MISKKSVDRVEYIFKNMEDAVFAVNMAGDLIYTNPAANRLFGLTPDSHGKIWDSVPFVEGNDALVQLFIDGVMEKKKSVQALVDYVNNDGKRFNLHVTLTCESEDSGMILVMIHDLTSLIKVHSAFERYTSPEIADYVLTTPDGEKQGGQNRDVSILMSDLRGFTALSTRLPSSDLITMLNNYFEHMADVIRHYGGTIIEFLGDGIFVVFGAPQDLPDHAAAAVSCAIEMQNAMIGVNEWNREHGYPELEMGIGVNSGSVVVGNIGSDQKMKYGCMGQTVNLAGRLESLTLGGEICISENTRDKISAGLTIVNENSFMPKGARKEMKFYSVAGIGPDCKLESAGGSIHWRKLPAARELVFYLLNGKTVDPEPHTGSLTKVSADEKYGLLATESVLQPLQNLMLRIGGLEVYAKVTKCGELGCRIGFTMKPDGFSELLS